MVVPEQETETSPLVVPLGEEPQVAAELNRLVVPLGEELNRLVVPQGAVPQVVESNRLVVPHGVAQDEEPVLVRSPLAVPLVPEWTPEQQVEPAEQRTLGSVPQEPGLSG